MKTRARILALPVVLLSLGGCGEKEEVAKAPPVVEAPGEAAVAEIAEAAEAVEETAEAVPEVVEEAVVELTLEQRAEKLGFARYLPEDTEGLIAFHNGTKAAEAVENSQLWALLQEGMGLGVEMDVEEMEFDPEMDEDFAIPEEEQEEVEVQPDGEAPVVIEPADEMPAEGAEEMTEEEAAARAAMEAAMEEAMLEAEMGGGLGEMGEMPEQVPPSLLMGREFSIALGKSGGEQIANVLAGYNRISFLQMRAMARGVVAAAKDGDMSLMSEYMMEHTMNQWTEFLQDPESGTGLLEKLEMPPLYISYRVSEENREAAAQQIAASVEFMGMFEGMVEPIEFEKAGGTFAGYRLIGENMAASLEEARADMESGLDEETMDKLIEILATKDMIMVSGVVGEYVVMFIGASQEDFRLVEDVESSLVGGEKLKFADPLLEKELACVVHGDAATLKMMMDASGGVGLLAEAVREGISGEEGLENTRDLESMLQIVEEREAALKALTKVETTGIVGIYEDGLKFESFGGVDNGMADWEAPLSLAALGDSPDVVLFANAATDAKYDEASTAYLEAMVETAYALTNKLGEYSIEGEEMEQAKEWLAIFDEKMRPEVATLWRTMNDELGEGLGSESAFVMDLKGGMPAFKGVPQEVVDSAKFVRMSMISPVTDRAKVAGSWEPMNAAATRLMAAVSEVVEDDIPMPKPIRSEEGGYTSWFFSLPFTDEDFIPCVTVGDDWFVASSSRLQSMELINQANAAPAGSVRTGVWFKMNFVALRKFAEETMTVMEEHSGAIFGEDSDALAEFEDRKEFINKVIAAMSNLDSLTSHSRRENGAMRSTIHFKTR